MELSTEYVGRRCRPLDIELTPRQTMNFAAGTADPNPCYFDDERPGGIIAPPMLATALTWKISSQMAQFQEADDFPAKVLTRQVHFTEILTCHRPMCPGGRLRIEGEVKAILPQRGGTHLVMEYRATGADGQPVFTEYVGALLRGVRCMGAAKGGENLPVPPASPPEKGLLWAKELHIGPLDAHIYDACGDIHFPIHTSPAFAHAVGLPGTIYHGTGTLSQAVREIVRAEADDDPCRVAEIGCTFSGMIRLNSTIQIQALARIAGTETSTIHFSVLNQEGKHAIKSAWVKLRCG